MKSEKGITLTSLILYVVILCLVVSTLSVISKYFFSNVGNLKDSKRYIANFNKFNMYFIEDVKNNKDLYYYDNEEKNKIIFEDGTIYTFLNESIYRNKVKICSDISECEFYKYEYENEGFVKKIIKVTMTIKDEDNFKTENEYVLKYW